MATSRAVKKRAKPKAKAKMASRAPAKRTSSRAAIDAALEDERSTRERAERTAEAFREVSLALGSTLDLDQLLELILQKITYVLEADRATLYLLDERRGRLVSRIVFGDDARSIELPIGEGIAGYVAQTGKSLRVKDAYRDKRFRAEWDRITGYRTQSILAAPMKNHVGRTIGVIQVLNKRGLASEFSIHDQELLDALATQAAVSIDNSRLFLSVIQKNMQLVETKEQLERRVADLKLLFELESAMGREATLEGFARAVIVKAAAACGAESGALLTADEDESLALYHVDPALDMDGAPNDGARPALVRRYTPKRGQGIIGRAMHGGEAVSFPDPGVRAVLESEAGTASARGGMPGLYPQSAIAVPLEGEDEQPIGALALYDSARGPASAFSQDDRALLRLVSANASTALQLFQSRMERERTERLTSIGRLLSGVMHDMRTPLTVISGYVQLMAAAGDPETRAEHAKHVLKQFDVLSAMQREVLEFARGERSILLRKVYLAKFFSDIEKHLAHELATQPNVKLEVELGDRGTARFDEAKMTRVLHNLARNAIDAMAATGGTLTIRVDRQDADLVVAVTDTGHGIPKEVHDRLFQSFVTHGKRGGTGLGLAIVKKIVDEHGGSIAVVTGRGGTTFTVRLPQQRDAKDVRPPLPTPAPTRREHRDSG